MPLWPFVFVFGITCVFVYLCLDRMLVLKAKTVSTLSSLPATRMTVNDLMGLA